MAALKALVVDDSKVMRMMVMTSLRKSGLAEFEFVEAEDGALALEKMKDGGIDIAFVDWNMPNMCGIDFVKAIRADGDTATPMIMVTSEKTMSKMEQALEEGGANAYICKPFTPEELAQKLGKFIEMAVANQQPAPSGGLFGRLFG